MSKEYLPAGFGPVSPFFIVSDAGGLIDFIKQAFEGEELSRTERPDGGVMHAAVAVDGAVLMVGERETVFQNSTHLYVPDVDETYRRCLSLGAERISEPRTFPYGDRSAGIRDPFGNIWWIGTHLGHTGSQAP